LPPNEPRLFESSASRSRNGHDSTAETVVEREVTGIIEEYNTSVRSMIVSLSSAKSDAEQEEAKRCFHEVIASYPDVTIRGFKPADQSVAVLFEMENLAVGKIVPDIEGKDA
jgi:hypothetical protein